MHDGWMYGMGWGWILLIAALMALVWLVLRSGRSGRTSLGGSQGSDPEELLKQRFARGEINEEEYRARLRALRDSS